MTTTTSQPDTAPFARRLAPMAPLMIVACLCSAMTSVVEGQQHHDPAAHGGHQQHQMHQAHEGHRNPDGYQHDFVNPSRWSDRFDAPERDAWQKPQHLVELMQIEAGMTVADIGAGTGYFVEHLAAAVGEFGTVHALDIQPGMVAFIAGRAHQAPWPQVDARQIAADDPLLEAASVDRIVIINTWHHIGARPAYAAKLLEALKPGGTLNVVDFTLDSPEGPPKQHRLPAPQIVEELEAGGFDAEILAEDLPRQFVVVGRKP